MMSMKIPMTLLRMELATFRFVVQCLNQLCHGVPHINHSIAVTISDIALICPVHKPQATKFCMVVCIVATSSVQNFDHVTQLAHRILKWLLDFWKIYAPLESGIAAATFYFYLGMLIIQ
jgi:hypothetical protein